MIVVAYLYNKNGMASWCIDAAKALHANGQQVVLIKSKNIQLPDDFPATIIDFDNVPPDTQSRSLLQKISGKVSKYTQLLPFSSRKDNFLTELHKHLQSINITPSCYLFNQTSLVNNKVNVPQYVVAWTYKPFFKDYVRKALLLSESLSDTFNNLYNAIFWHKVDWDGYKNAKGVFSVSEKLKILLTQSGIKAYTVHPGTSTGNINLEAIHHNKIVKFAMVALDVDDKRKGLRQIVEKLKNLKPYNFHLTLIGGAENDFKSWVLQDGFPATFTGLLDREKAVEVLNDCDVLLFGSLVDDWGFVQVEAMAKGMAVLSPKASPFDEIIGRDDYLYDQNSPTDLEEKLQRIISSTNVSKDKAWFKYRYDNQFSLKVFGEKLIQIIVNN